MRFSYGTSFKIEPPEAYERLLADALAGDQTLLLREDSIERALEIVAAPLAAPGPTHFYPAGTWGPGADELIAPHRWHLR
jgi:glucose-6-phosphate 1-dehydrogenase